MIIVFFIILVSGFALYVLLKPPVELFKEPAEKEEFFAELRISNVSLPEFSKRKKRKPPTMLIEKE